MIARRPSTLQFILVLALVLVAVLWTWTHRNTRPLAALAVGLTGLLVVGLLALVHLFPSEDQVATVSSKHVRRAVETAAHLAFLGAYGACLHEPGLALAGCACRLA